MFSNDLLCVRVSPYLAPCTAPCVTQTLLETRLSGSTRMFRDQRTTDPDQVTRDDYTTADDGIVYREPSAPRDPCLPPGDVSRRGNSRTLCAWFGGPAAALRTVSPRRHSN